MAADRARVATAHQLLAQLGLTLADLQGDLSSAPSAPTMGEYLPRVMAAAGPGSRRTYGPYWSRLSDAFGDRPLDTIAASDLEALQRQIVASALSRSNSRGGRHSGEHLISAARAVYNRAIADGLINADSSPAHRVRKPRRLPSTRRALTAQELEFINTTARSSGNDVVLDALLLRLHTETACRRGGALALRLMDLDSEQGLIRLREKGGTERWQPITLELATHLADHASQRGSRLASDGLLRYRSGHILTTRRYDALWARLGRRLRHTTLTWVERHFGYGIARADAGHTDSNGPATTTYIKANLEAVATALAVMTGQPHPHAASADDQGSRHFEA
jgi:site-specific recombinase XerD